ncbi:DNA sulfur modification protein DndB [Priestia megaterium]|uniref:DNA sulfur modification protein DndB n=1 Tax=Priestia megaterium TaxID=1404 RepID=UPI0021D69CCD|nr:DNA sulfur modification protein DndB [Priestia megaterium]MCU7766498.1 DNA sulfur modification protein DndB [Priestia megaterium]
MNRPKIDIGISFSGAAGSQFGRNIFTTMIPYKSIESFLKVFPEVQRNVNKARVKAIAEYVLNGVNEKNYCFLSAVTTTCRGEVEYNDQSKTVTIDINSILSINDGQHRVEGIKLALKNLRNQVKKEKSTEEKLILSKKLEHLENMCIPVVIFESMDEQHEQQLFHDLNNLAKTPTKSISLKFDNTDPYTAMAKELAKENDYLIKYGVETEKTQLRDNNPNLMLLSTLRNTISFMVSGSDKDKNNALTLENYDDQKNTINEVFDELFKALPSDANDRKKYIIGTAVTLQGIGKYIHSLMNDDDIVDWKSYVSGLQNINWKHDNKMWNGYGGNYDAEKRKFVFGGTGGGINGVRNALNENNRPIHPHLVS